MLAMRLFTLKAIITACLLYLKFIFAYHGSLAVRP